MYFLRIFYRGNKVECNVCGHHFRKFLPYGRGKSARSNALCPKCLSLERHRLMWLYLHETTGFFKKKHKVLHIAPEHAFIKTLKNLPNIDYTTADLESPWADVKMDIHQIPFEDKSFDVVFCNHVMEHVEDDIKAMSEIHRILNDTGWAIIQSPQDMSLKTTYEDKTITTAKDRFEAFGQEDHVRMYGKDYGKRLEKAGFKVLEDKFVQQLPQEEVARHALPKEEIIYFCMK